MKILQVAGATPVGCIGIYKYIMLLVRRPKCFGVDLQALEPGVAECVSGGDSFSGVFGEQRMKEAFRVFGDIVPFGPR